MPGDLWIPSHACVWPAPVSICWCRGAGRKKIFATRSGVSIAANVPDGITARVRCFEVSRAVYLSRGEFGRRLGPGGRLYPSEETEYGGDGLVQTRSWW